MPTLKSLPASTGEAEILAALNRDGAVIVADLMSTGLADQIVQETGPFIDASPVGSDFTGHQTRRTGALAARSAGCCELILNETMLAGANAYLGPFCDRIQLHLTQTIHIMPGQRAQYLHRDRQAWGEFIPPAIQPQFNTIWALTDFTEENGATQVVPGSHLWDYDRKAEEHEIARAVMERGSVLIYSGSVIHGGGANSSEVNRTGINITYTLGWLRQEENQYLSCPPDIAKDLDPRLQELLGYSMGSVATGYYSEPLPAGEARELCPPEFALGRKPLPENAPGVMEQAS